VRTRWFSLVFLVLLVGSSVAQAQHPLLDSVAQRVVQKVQQSTCEQLWESRGKPKPEREREVVQLLRGDPALMNEFLGIVAAPVAAKMLECGLIP
jgi:hypothetical protein